MRSDASRISGLPAQQLRPEGQRLVRIPVHRPPRRLHMAQKRMLVAVFRDRVNAQTAYDRLVNRGYSNSELNVLMSDSTRAAYQAERHEEKHSAGTHAVEGAATGGAVGTALGATLAAVMAAGTAIMIPGIGWVSGPVIAALAGAGAGAITGGLVG